MKDLLQRITVPCVNEEGSIVMARKAGIVRELLRGSEWYLQEWVSKKSDFLLYARDPVLVQDKKYLLISTHIDTVREMNPCFSREEEACFFGTYDNSLTNAVALDLMLTNRFGDRILVAFTGNEEYGMRGANDVCAALGQMNIERVLVLDVTYEKYFGQDFTFENCHHRPEEMELFTRCARSRSDKFQINAIMDDDETMVYSKHYSCMSLCVPVQGTMHSSLGVRCSRPGLTVYAETLALLSDVECQAETH